MAWLVGIEPTSKKPARMWLLEAKLMGAKDEASLDREIATIGTFDKLNDASPIRLIARLSDAKPAELQSLVGSKGLKLCKRQGEKKTCASIAQKSIDAKKAKQIVDRAGVIASYARDDSDLDEGLQVPSCSAEEKNPKRIDCVASIRGPAGGAWIFERTDAGLRLVEVWSWAEDS
jgi:hypothetical protein